MKRLNDDPPGAGGILWPKHRLTYPTDWPKYKLGELLSRPSKESSPGISLSLASTLYTPVQCTAVYLLCVLLYTTTLINKNVLYWGRLKGMVFYSVFSFALCQHSNTGLSMRGKRVWREVFCLNHQLYGMIYMKPKQMSVHIFLYILWNICC